MQKEEPSCVFSHGAHILADVEQETTLYELHDDVDEVADDSTAGLVDRALITVVGHTDDAAVVEVLQNCDFILDRKDAVLVSVKELFLKDLDCHVGVGINKAAAKVHFGSVAFS